jgi:Bacterial pre-peptidase C-terminal domain
MKRLLPPLWVTMIILGGLLLSTVLAQTGSYSISAWVVAGGGGGSAGGGYGLDGTIGQSDAGHISSGNYTLDSGYWALDDTIPVVFTPGPHIYLPAVQRGISPTPTRTPTPTPTPTQMVGPPPSCGDIEPNNDPDHPSTLQVIGGPCSGALGSADREDWYVLSMNAGQTFDIDLTQIGTGEDYDLYLHGPDKVLASICAGVAGGQCKSSRLGPSDEHLTGTIVQSGPYYILVYGYARSGPTHTYVLKVSFR